MIVKNNLFQELISSRQRILHPYFGWYIAQGQRYNVRKIRKYFVSPYKPQALNFIDQLNWKIAVSLNRSDIPRK